MKITLDWLTEYVDLPTKDPDAISETLENLGHEVEGYERIEPSFRGVVVGRVLEVGSHPDADKVRRCLVDVGTGEPSEIVCGAWNFEAGALVPVALPGAVLGGGVTIGRRAIRGIVSNGMICSERELELGEDGSGIMVLDEYPAAAGRVGEDLTTVVPFPLLVLDVSITPNRPDCMSVYGLARELAAAYGVPLRRPDLSVDAPAPPGDATVTIADPVACPRFVAREVRDLRSGPSPHWMRRRLAACGMRPISNIVDASNYAMLEFGHPTHAFDLDRLGPTVVARRARPGERIVTLDGVERDLRPEDVVVADADRPVAIAGIMGGAATEVDDTTTRVLIEAAYWDPASILLTSKRLGLRSEASARFERGMDPNFCPPAADRVAQLLVAHAGGTVVAGPIDVYPEPILPRRIVLPLGEIRRVLGIELEAPRVAALLGSIGLQSATTEDPLVVEVPTRRPDVRRPVDLVEEVARLHGFARIPGRVRTGDGGGLPDPEARRRRLRQVLLGAGYHEVVNFSFLSDEDLDRLGLPAGDPLRDAVALTNPLSDEEGVLRTTLLPGLLRAAATNQGRQVGDPVRLFETGKVFLRGDDELPDQPDRLAFVAVGRAGRNWGAPGREIDVFDGLGVWELLVGEFDLEGARREAATAPAFHPGRCAALLLGDRRIGVVGEIHPQVADRFGVAGRVVAGELALGPVADPREAWRFHPPSTYPPVIFDLAFALPDTVPAGRVLTVIEEAGGDLLERGELFDVFRGPSVGAGRKSVAVRIVLRAADRTLEESEAAEVRRAIVAAVETATGAELRGSV